MITAKEAAAVKAFRAKHTKYLQEMDKRNGRRELGYGDCLWMRRSNPR